MIHCDIKPSNVLLDAHFVVILVISGWQDFLMILLQATPVQFSWSKRNNRICGSVIRNGKFDLVLKNRFELVLRSRFDLVSVFGQELVRVGLCSRFDLVSVFGQELVRVGFCFDKQVVKVSSLPSSNVAAKISQNEDTQSRDLPAAVPVKPSSPRKNAEGITIEAAHKVLEEEQNHKSSITEESRGANNDDQLVENNSPDPNGQEAANKETYASIVARPIPPQASWQVLADKPSSNVVSATPVSSVLPLKQVPAPSYGTLQKLSI
ncbi:hypothetical protein L6452_13827 [Arctium lappa]|uniref:Uncharacterized protein n=1 Tax=Arctium lappa TaxID=4217 RepID=A0ACB9CJD8_ARCLA|nr:hypothetical protein L6452_13827 [Arctium lappa]